MKYDEIGLHSYSFLIVFLFTLEKKSSTSNLVVRNHTVSQPTIIKHPLWDNIMNNSRET